MVDTRTRPTGRGGRERSPAGEIWILDPYVNDTESLEDLHALVSGRDANARCVVIGNRFQSNWMKGRGFEVELVTPGSPQSRLDAEMSITQTLNESRAAGSTRVRVTVQGKTFVIDLASLALCPLWHLWTHIAVHEAMEGVPLDADGRIERAVVYTDRSSFFDAVSSLHPDVEKHVPGRGRGTGTHQKPGDWSRRLSRAARMAIEGARLMRPGRDRRMVVTGSHRQLIPVIDRLEQRGDVLTLTELPALLCWLERLISESELVVADVEQALQRLRLAGDDLEPRHRAILESYLSEFHLRVPELLRRSIELLSALERVSPDAILANHWEGYPSHVQRAWCSANDKTFAVVQHGFQVGSRISAETRVIDADVFYCWSEEYRRKWIDTETHPHVNIRATGNPVHSRDAAAPVSVTKNGRTVLFAPSAPREYAVGEYVDLWDWLFEFVDSHAGSNYDWVARPHSLCPMAPALKDRARHLEIEWSANSEGFLSVLRRATFLVSTVSTAALDGFSLGRPVVIANNMGEPEFYSDYDAGVVVNDVHQIGPALNRISEDVDFRCGLLDRQQRMFDAFSTSHAAKRVATHFVETINSREVSHGGATVSIDSGS